MREEVKERVGGRGRVEEGVREGMKERVEGGDG